MSQLKTLDLSMNPLNSPLDILAKDGFFAVLNYLRSQSGDTVAITKNIGEGSKDL